MEPLSQRGELLQHFDLSLFNRGFHLLVKGNSFDCFVLWTQLNSFSLLKCCKEDFLSLDDRKRHDRWQKNKSKRPCKRFSCVSVIAAHHRLFCVCYGSLIIHDSLYALLLTPISLCVSRLQEEEEAVMKLCLQSLSLRSLSREPSVSSSQMILCCKRLLEQRSPLMQGLHICVSHFYSVMQDGDLCVPWDWKSWVEGKLLSALQEWCSLYKGV